MTSLSSRKLRQTYQPANKHTDGRGALSVLFFFFTSSLLYLNYVNFSDLGFEIFHLTPSHLSIRLTLSSFRPCFIAALWSAVCN